MELLEWKRKIAKSTADKKATNEYNNFRVEQGVQYIWDFDKLVYELYRLSDEEVGIVEKSLEN